jgi:hypothetical protein
MVIAAIAKFDFPKKWPGLLNTFIQYLRGDNALLRVVSEFLYNYHSFAFANNAGTGFVWRSDCLCFTHTAMGAVPRQRAEPFCVGVGVLMQRASSAQSYVTFYPFFHTNSPLLRAVNRMVGINKVKNRFS